MKFNKYIKVNVRLLHKYSKTMHNLLVNLTKGYLAYKDRNFRKYINDLISQGIRITRIVT